MKHTVITVLTLALTLGAAGACDSEGSNGATTTATDTTTDTTSADTTSGDTASVAWPGPATPWDLTKGGHFGVGYRTETLTYKPADDSGDRELRVALWYPTTDTTGAEVKYIDVVARPGVHGDASLAVEYGPFPLLVYSHGNGGLAEISWFLTEFFASHGFVVAAVDHTGNTFFDGFGIDPEIYYLRPWDISALLDHLQALPETDPLAGAITDDIAVTGHSFGGYTTLALGGATWNTAALDLGCNAGVISQSLCAAYEDIKPYLKDGFRDERVKVAIPLAPGLTRVFGDSIGSIVPPSLLITARRDATTSNATEGNPTWAALDARADARRIDFKNAGHFTFTNVCELGLPLGQNDGCSGVGFIDPPEAHAATNGYMLAFVRRHLFGDESGAAYLDDNVTLSDDAVLFVGGQ